MSCRYLVFSTGKEGRRSAHGSGPSRSSRSEHPAVAERAAIAAPDADRGEDLEAFVVLSTGWEASAALEDDLNCFVKTNHAALAYPRAVYFVPELPKTPSGKTQRFVLREVRRSELAKAGQGRHRSPSGWNREDRFPGCS
ncbi:hypothetical protein AB0O52_10560 [Arthrobacter sp. NPDC080073]|uniref:AMP-binding enzyme n=1 Tax=Arthrobacter sp. NPDC080073 TaxID=3155919 RepID=UPI003433D50C